MNITRLFLEVPREATLTHVASATSRTTRTSGELRRNVAAAAQALRKLNVQPGDHVLILCGSRVEALECLLATVHEGATAMPVTPLIGNASLEAIVARTRPACCIFEDPPEPAIQRALEARRCAMISIKRLPPTAPADWHSYETLIDAPAELEYPSFADRHPALLIHSSGSTGGPKAVLMSHGALLRFFEYHELLWRQYSDSADTFATRSPFVTGLPLAHLGGISLSLQGLMAGRPTYLMSFFLPHLYLKLIESTRCSCFMLVPSMLRSVLKEPYLRHMDRSALRFCITGGEACTLDLCEQVREAFGVPLVTAYSMTECLSGIGHSRRDLFAGRVKPMSCGRQLFGELSLRDRDGKVAANDGELWVRNETVHDCYPDPGLREAKLSGGWLRTGDLFHRDEDGDFFHRGRVDDMFVCNGKNIYPQEIERLLMQHPAIEIACAAPVSSRRKGVVPAALIVARQPLSDAEVQDFLMRNGPSHAVPQVVRIVDSLPRIGPGKVDRPGAARLLQAAYDALQT